jgi:thiamine pyrophosphate-dependent acetolactate synthase large subunit-like protein
MRSQRDDSRAWVRECILASLGCTAAAVPRDVLTERVLDYGCERLGLRWKRSTAGRRVRDALEELRDSDHPVLSAGHGFKLAVRATPQERERAAVLCEKRGAKEFANARKYRAITLPGDPVVSELFAPGHPGIEWRP